MTDQRLAYAMMLAAPGMFATNMLVARATADWFPPMALAFWRWTATAALMAALLRGALWASRGVAGAEWRRILALGTIGMGVCGAFVYLAADTTTATNIGLIYAAAPVAIILLGRALFGERLGKVQTLGVALAFAGVAIIVLRGSLDTLLGLRFAPGDLWALGGALGWAVYTVLLRHWRSELGVNLRFAWIALGGAATLLPFALAEALLAGPPPATAASAGWVALLATVASVGAYQTYGIVQRGLGTARAGLILYLTPLYTAGLAWLFLGEGFARHHAVGAALLLPGIYLATRRPG
jgi:drug/metabolite transporter (DMT)-like permease